MNAAIHPRPAAERAPSYYAATLNEETDYPTLLGAVTVDIAIIGGGFTGVATAVELAERGYKVALVETHRIGWGASGRNGGQVTGSLSGDAAMHKQMRQWLGAEVEDFIWHLRWRGHEIIRQRVERYGIACDLRHGHLHAAMKASHMGELQASYEEAVRRGMGDQVVLLDKAGVQAHLETELYSRRAEEHPQHAPAPAQPVHRRGQGGGRPRRADLRTFRGAGYRPRPAAGGDYPRGKGSRRSRSRLPAMSTTSSNAGSSRG